ncbi:MAG: AraC family transcriptional regulator [Cytophagales bacterium]|nr:MAG: AraC family transcriptional regulator [Cytophagales bacterium]
MNFQPKIKSIKEKKLVGKRQSMSLANYTVQELWHEFMLEKALINYRANQQLISMVIYPSNYFERFNPNTTFEKWASAEVSDFEDVPKNLDTFILPAGLYAIFRYKGLAANASNFFQYIFGDWLPSSGYELDQRPHFEVLDPDYKPNDPSSEEDIYIPIQSTVA